MRSQTLAPLLLRAAPRTPRTAAWSAGVLVSERRARSGAAPIRVAVATRIGPPCAEPPRAQNQHAFASLTVVPPRAGTAHSAAVTRAALPDPNRACDSDRGALGRTRMRSKESGVRFAHSAQSASDGRPARASSHLRMPTRPAPGAPGKRDLVPARHSRPGAWRCRVNERSS